MPTSTKAADTRQDTMESIEADFAPSAHLLRWPETPNILTACLYGGGDVLSRSLPAIMHCRAEFQLLRIVLLDVIPFDDVLRRIECIDLPGRVAFRDLESATNRCETICAGDPDASQFEHEIEYLQIEPGWLDYETLNKHALLGSDVCAIVQAPDRLHASLIFALAPVVGIVGCEKPLTVSPVEAAGVVRANSLGNIFSFSHWLGKEEISQFIQESSENTHDHFHLL